MTASSSGAREIAIIGASCRLPGASSLSALWSLLSEGRCAVSKIPENRWSGGQFFHPRRFEPGKSYTWSAGVLDDIWGFDPGVFGISPRESEQMDPQQRLLLELVWEALEDAGIPPSSLASKEIGVFVGASALDYGNRSVFDVAAGDAHFATGNTLSLIANRVSYIFDLRGPSFTVDTACSSSLVALHQAVAEIQGGRIDTAIVGGVNVLASPFAFISFSQASMLSPTGLCRAFDAKADGYVRAEGGVVLILRSVRAALRDNDRILGLVAGSGVNSDGRTVGVSMPSSAAQTDLLSQVYGRFGVDPSALAFIEAHGTGTRVGDPAEATAIGNALGRTRAQPLPIGSIKTNIGHLEPAAGLAGVLKALLALEHDFLPPSLHFSEPNPDIAFRECNICVCSDGLPLDRGAGRRFAGVNSFGFGGTNAHVIVSDPPSAGRTERVADQASAGQPVLLVSAQSHAALTALADEYASRLESASDREARAIVLAAAHQRDHLSNRTAVTSRSRHDFAAALRSFAQGDAERADLLSGTAAQRNSPLAFVYSGNGSQWPGMGRSAYLENEVFRAHFDEAAGRFEKLAGWSLKAAIFDDKIEELLRLTSIAQPLIFAIQYAATAALRQLGMKPVAVIGHSVGEIAAAHAAGMLDIDDAVKVIYFRSRHQERARDRGRMAVLMSAPPIAERLAEEISDLDIAAFNSSHALTLSGTTEAIAKLVVAAEQQGIVCRRLDLDYPFHSRLMDVIEQPLLDDLQELRPRAGGLPLISTVTGAATDGNELDARYWWRNIREPVQFAVAIRNVAALGARVFIEIGPRATLLSHLKNTLAELSIPFAVLGVLDGKSEDGDPFRRAAAKCWANGGKLDLSGIVGPAPAARIRLPSYRWQRKEFRIDSTVEALPVVNQSWRHPLIGARIMADAVEWRGHLDPALLPQLNDHRVDGQVLLPGAALAEMALAAARDWLDSAASAITDLELLQPVVFTDAGSREISTRVCFGTGVLEIRSRRRLSSEPWQLHATCKIARTVVPADRPAVSDRQPSEVVDGDVIYAFADEVALQFGPSFRQLKSVARLGPSKMVVSLIEPTDMDGFGLDPARLDSCFHGLVVLFADRAAQRRTAFLPVRFGDIRLFKPGTAPARALIEVDHCDERLIRARFTLLGGEDEVVAIIHDARFHAIKTKARDAASCALVQSGRPLALASYGHHAVLPMPLARFVETFRSASEAGDGVSEGSILLQDWATACAMSLLAGLADRAGDLDIDALIASGRLADSCAPWIACLLSWLEASKLALPTGAGRRIATDAARPDPATIVRTLAREHPDRCWELLLASRLIRLIEGTRDDPTAPVNVALPRALLDLCDGRSTWMAEAGKFLSDLLQALESLWPRKHGIRMLQVGFGPLSHLLASRAQTHGARLTVLELDRQRREHAGLALRDDGVELCGECSTLPPATFDVIISAGSLCRWQAPETLIPELVAALAPGGLLVAVERIPSLFRDLVFGTDETWFAPNSIVARGRLRSAEDWRQILASAALQEHVARSVAMGAETATFLMARGNAVSELAPAPEKLSIMIRTGADARTLEVARHVERLFAADGHQVAVRHQSDGGLDSSSVVPLLVIDIGDCFRKNGSPLDALRDRCLALKALVEDLSVPDLTLWTVTSGAFGDELTSPIEAGYWAFTRTVANEFPNLKMRRVDLSPGLSAEHAGGRIKDLILSAGDETELRLQADAACVVRIEQLDRLARNLMQDRATQAGLAARVDADSSENEAADHHNGTRLCSAARLERRGGLDGLCWRATGRGELAPDQIEIEVEATGLNFRDLMWALSLLPDELLADGFAGPCLGLECAGRVVRLGSAVTNLALGSRVVALARSAFATHVTVPSWAALLVPGNLSSEAAATIPVAFVTAYYALVTLARVERDEWVLIHGGAGGVGLAALQIARWRGARVIATAGSEEKRDLLRILGAEHVLDSRTTAFADEVRAIAPDGVDVVLNSLSGEAMELGIGLVKPFGRFLELGKRDYLANTHVGLRPFRRNLTYFGIDLDQLLKQRPDLGSDILKQCAALLEKRVFYPLPFCRFPASEVVDAFRLMQQSRHVGKIVVAPPKSENVQHRSKTGFAVDPDKTHVVTGAFNGFGSQAARWLARRGARYLVMLGRRGPASPDAERLIAELHAMGVVTRAEACDVADFGALRRLFETLPAEFPPVGGVMHAAMVLADATIVNLSAEQLQDVLRPKVLGAENLDRLTRGFDLDYFILFSSATTFVGGPGQGSYVAANAYMEGLARRRRGEGLPAHAIAWGAIGDAGALARDRTARELLARRVGATSMTAREALDLMAEALSEPAAAEHPVLALATFDWSAARAQLATLSSPTYQRLGNGRADPARPERAAIDLGLLIRENGIENARAIVLELVTEEVSRVLRMPKDQISLVNPLAEAGLDSLMAVELAHSLRTRTSMQMPLTMAAGSLTVTELVRRLLAQAGESTEERFTSSGADAPSTHAPGSG